MGKKNNVQVLQSDLVRIHKWPFQGWKRDLHLGNQQDDLCPSDFCGILHKLDSYKGHQMVFVCIWYYSYLIYLIYWQQTYNYSLKKKTSPCSTAMCQACADESRGSPNPSQILFLEFPLHGLTRWFQHGRGHPKCWWKVRESPPKWPSIRLMIYNRLPRFLLDPEYYSCVHGFFQKS